MCAVDRQNNDVKSFVSSVDKNTLQTFILGGIPMKYTSVCETHVFDSSAIVFLCPFLLVNALKQIIVWLFL